MPKMKLNYESGRTEYALESRFLTEIYGDVKKLNHNGLATKSNIYDTGFDGYLNRSQRAESLDQRMSSHINVVNVSGKQTNTNSTSSSTPSISAADYNKYKKGTKVRHSHFGDGVVTLGVTDFASAFVTIQFEKVGNKTLSLKYAKLEIIE